MRKIIYYVATSLDGYICGRDGDISMFKTDGEGVEQYLYDLESFDTVIMGRNTYEFGYRYGLKPGQLAYKHMDHYIFSNDLTLKNRSEKLHVSPLDIECVKQLKADVGSSIYLCGGGMFAGWLMEHGLIDVLKLKINPMLIGTGVRLFGNYDGAIPLNPVHKQTFKDGLAINTYEIVNS